MQILRSKNLHVGLFWLLSLLALLVPVASINYPSVLCYMAFGLVILGLCTVIVGPDLKPFSKLEKLMFFTWLFYPLFTALDFWLRTGWIWHQFQEPSRFILVMPIYLMVRRFGLSQTALKWGVFLGAIIAGFWAFYQKHELGLDRAYGGTSGLKAAFGCISLLLGVISVALFQPNWSKDKRWWLVVLISLSFGTFASISSGAKSGWISAPVLCLILVSLAHHPTHTKRFVALAVMMVVATFVWSVSPFVQARIESVVPAVFIYFETGQVTEGSSSIRLALWHAATLVFIDNPLFGVGPSNFTVAKLPYIEAGLVPEIVGQFHGAHSQFFESLYESGIFGPIMVFSIYGSFILFCRSFLIENKALATAGILLAAGFIDFGIAEVIWDINNAGVFFTVMMALIAGKLSFDRSQTCLNPLIAK